MLPRLTNMNQIKVSYKRHLAKTISYRIISTLIGFLGMWWVTGNINFGVAFGIAELIYKPIQYYIHERIWYKWIKFGLITEFERKKKDQPKKTPESLPTPPSSTRSKKVLSYKKPN